MTTYVLVHGAWGGAHGFRGVRRLLREAGHNVFTPSLTGIGERSHLTGPAVGLATHVQDVANTILYEDLRDVVLLGFSYGGAVVVSSLELVGDRVRHLVLLDAFVPDDGQSVWELVFGEPAAPSGLGEDWQVAGPVRSYDDPADADFMGPRRSPQPRRTFTDQARVPRPLEDWPFTRTYVKATDAQPDDLGEAAFRRAAEHARTSPAWRYAEIVSTHMVPVNRPLELVDLLLALDG